MASGTANSPRQTDTSPPKGGGQRHYEQFIDQQLGRTCLRIKLVDSGARIMALVGAVLAYLLLVTLLDHWVLELGFLGRLAALLLLVVGVIYFGVTCLLPLAIRRINPAFAAHAVEQSEPTIKNSLLNYLMLPANSRGTQLVYRALRQRAALDLRNVNPDEVVDWTQFLHIGYAVVVLMVLFAGYTILSPKDVFQTIFRVAAPWGDIARPTAVQIIDVQPGNREVLRGQQVLVSARLDGVNADDAILLRYSSQDVQTVDQPLRMEPTGIGRRYECLLPPDERGIQQDLIYRIQAGDARTADFRLQVLPAPHILVEKIEYDYPDYTGLNDRTVLRQGDIHAPEGTLVKISAKASHPIAAAFIEFDPGSDAENRDSQPVRRNMTFHDHTASFSFPLTIDDQSTSKYETYQLSFISQDDLRSQQAVVHKISVVPDLAPEISILTPPENHVDVPEDGSLRIEVRALDPDYGLTLIQLQAVVDNQQELEEVLFREPNGETGPIMAQFDFRPRQLGLSAGTQVTLWAVAEDGRTEIGSGSPAPNQRRTDNYHLTIVAAQDRSQQPENQEPTEPQLDRSGDSEPTPAPKPSSTDPSSRSDAPDPSEQPPDAADADPANSDDTDSQEPSGSEPAESSQPEDTQQDQRGSESESDPGGQQQAGEDQAGEPTSEDPASEEPSTQPGEQSPAGDASQTDDASASTQPGGEPSAGASSTPDPDSTPSDSSQTSQGDSSNAADQPRSANDQPSSAKSSRGEGESSDGRSWHDGEVFQRALEHFQEQNQSSQQPPAGSDPDSDDSRTSDPSSGQTSDATRPVNPSNDDQPGKSDDPGATSEDDTSSSPSESNSESLPDPSAPGDGTGEESGPPSPTDGTNASQPGDAPADRSPGTQESSAEGSEGEASGRQEGMPNGSEQPPAESQNDQAAEPETGPASGTTEQTGDDGQRTAEPNSTADAGSGQEGPETGNAEAGKQPQPPSARNDPSAPPASTASDDSDGQGEANENPTATGQTPPANSDRQSATSPATDQSPDGDPSAQEPAASGDPASSADSAAGTDSAAGDDSGSSSNPGQQPTANTEPSESTPAAADQNSPSSNGETSTERDSPQDPTDQPPQAGGSGTAGGGGTGPSSAAGREEADSVPDGEAANLAYAEEATDLVLERLKDQQQRPDPELLESLNWTPERLRQFVRRWESLKQAAREDHPDAQAELVDALRSLGLRRSAPTRQNRRLTNDTPGGLLDTGGRSQPPAEFLDEYNAYKKGSARTGSPQEQ